jgi:hypothetical protein
MIKMYKDSQVMDVNPNPDGIKILESYGWSQDKPKAKKKSKELEVPSLTEKNIDDNSE